MEAWEWMWRAVKLALGLAGLLAMAGCVAMGLAVGVFSLVMVMKEDVDRGEGNRAWRWVMVAGKFAGAWVLCWVYYLVVIGVVGLALALLVLLLRGGTR